MQRCAHGAGAWGAPFQAAARLHRCQKQIKIRELFMSTKFVAAVAVLTAVGAAVALAQGQPPKASKAEVQRLVDGIKADKTKFSHYCELTKLEVQGDAIAQKNRNDPKLQELGRQCRPLPPSLGLITQELRVHNSTAQPAHFSTISLGAATWGSSRPKLRQRRGRLRCRSLLTV